MTRYTPAILAAGLLLTADVPASAQDLEGSWTIVSIEKEGKKQEDNPQTVDFKGGKYTLTAAEGFTRSKDGSYKLDRDKSPGHIVLTPAEGPNKDKAIMGIYKVEGDRMIACYDPTGAGRPTKFATETNTPFVLVTYMKKTR